jgi:hypothetical protein
MLRYNIVDSITCNNIGKYSFHGLPIRNSQEQGVLSPPLFGFSVAYAIGKVQEVQKWTLLFLLYANYVNLLGGI